MANGKFRVIEEFRESAGRLDAWRMEGHPRFFRSLDEDFQESASGPCPWHDGHHARHIEPAGAAEPLHQVIRRHAEPGPIPSQENSPVAMATSARSLILRPATENGILLEPTLWKGTRTASNRGTGGVPSHS